MALVVTAATLLIIAGLILYNASVSQEWHDAHRGEEVLTENDHYYGRLFYINGNDKRIFVPKHGGGGYTLNIANPLSYLLIVLFLAAVAVIITVS